MARMVGSFLVLSVLVVALVAAAALREARRAFQDSVFARLRAVAVLKQDEMERWIGDQRRYVQLLAQLPALRAQVGLLLQARPGSPPERDARERLAETLAVLAGGRPDLRETFALTDEGGLVAASTERRHEGQYRVDAVYFREGRAGTFVQNVYVSPETLEPTITVATPLRDLAGRRLGVLVSHLDLGRMEKIVGERTGLGKTGESYLVNRSGEVVSFGRLGRPTFPRGAKSPAIDAALRGENGRGLYSDYQGRPVVGVYLWLHARELALVVELGQEEAFAPARRLVGAVALVGLGSATLLAVGIFFVSRRVVAPIRAMTKAAAAVAGGDLSREAPVTTRDEVGTLARAFNEMTARLRSLYAGLEAKVAELLRAQSALKASEERYALAMRGARDGLWDWDLEKDEVYYSPRWMSMLGLPEAEGRAGVKEWHERVHPDDLKGLKAAISSHLAGLTPHFQYEHRIRHRDGGYRWMLCRGLAVRGESGQAVRVAGSLTDITKRKSIEEQLLRSAFYDAMTGLPNRALFMNRLDHVLARARREGSGPRFAVLFLDLDRFKVVNDSLGHGLGDRLLERVARRLEACLRPGDTVARLGGDEFTLLLEEVTGESDAVRVAERIHQAMAFAFEIEGHEVFASASVGIAVGSHEYQEAEDVLRDADTAMYRAKGHGRSRHVVFDSAMHAQAVVRLETESDLRHALERQELCSFYQPIVSLAGRKIAGFEALARWRHPVRGLVLPVEFIPVAEETGLIFALGTQVLDQACHQLARWQERFAAPRPLTMSVNCSPRQLMQPALAEEIAHVLERTRLEGSALHLEITESAMLEASDSAADTLAKLRELGVEIYVDDFGTGYSALAYLRRFPISGLKIDRSFVGLLGRPGHDGRFAESIVNLARGLDLAVVAEGVESETQAEILTELGCAYAQGHFFAQALQEEDAGRLLSADRD
jgi:diguanylate cyclase (GGDEF)-like protein/PAS domain S-box-containing protein